MLSLFGSPIQIRMTSEQKVFFTQEWFQPVADSVCRCVKTGLHRLDIYHFQSQRNEIYYCAVLLARHLSRIHTERRTYGAALL